MPDKVFRAVMSIEGLKQSGYLFQRDALYVDNKSAIDVAYNPQHHGRMKHDDRRCRYEYKLYYDSRTQTYHQRWHDRSPLHVG